MTLEVVQGAQGLRASPQSGGNEPATQKKLARVLLVDDEPSICKAFSMAISRAGYDVLAAQSGESALAIVRAEHIDVMVIDVRIPDMRGDVIFEVAAGLQPHLRYQSLFITGDITDKVQKLIAACKCHHLMKPCDLRDLTAAIAGLAPRVQDAAG